MGRNSEHSWAGTPSAELRWLQSSPGWTGKDLAQLLTWLWQDSVLGRLHSLARELLARSICRFLPKWAAVASKSPHVSWLHQSEQASGQERGLAGGGGEDMASQNWITSVICVLEACYQIHRTLRGWDYTGRESQESRVIGGPLSVRVKEVDCRYPWFWKYCGKNHIGIALRNVVKFPGVDAPIIC